MEGRWQINNMKMGLGWNASLGGPITESLPVAVVPCDDAAAERAAQALYELGRGQSWPGVLHGIEVNHVGLRIVAEVVLRAAGESP
jgi:hypothetical protein